jgi:hypothetical protein
MTISTMTIQSSSNEQRHIRNQRHPHQEPTASTSDEELTRQPTDHDLGKTSRTIREEIKAECDATIFVVKADLETKLAKQEEDCAKRIEVLEKENLDIKCEVEIVEFLAYLCGADISPPPPIPSIWHTERSSMRRTIYSTLLAYANRQLLLPTDSYLQKLINRLMKGLRW